MTAAQAVLLAVVVLPATVGAVLALTRAERAAAPVAVAPYAYLNRIGLSPDPDTWTIHNGAMGVFNGSAAEERLRSNVLTGALDDLDGFFTFVVGTESGFAVVRDPIACKPAVMAETDDLIARKRRAAG